MEISWKYKKNYRHNIHQHPSIIPLSNLTIYKRYFLTRVEFNLLVQFAKVGFERYVRGNEVCHRKVKKNASAEACHFTCSRLTCIFFKLPFQSSSHKYVTPLILDLRLLFWTCFDKFATSIKIWLDIDGFHLGLYQRFYNQGSFWRGPWGPWPSDSQNGPHFFLAGGRYGPHFLKMAPKYFGRGPCFFCMFFIGFLKMLVIFQK